MKLISTNYGKTLTFDTYSGIKYANLKFVSLLDPDTAINFLDIHAEHIQNMPYMKDPKPTLATDYSYAKFVSADGKKIYLGVPWVNEDSITLNSVPNYRMTLIAPTQDQLDSLKSMAIASGIENFTLEAI